MGPETLHFILYILILGHLEFQNNCHEIPNPQGEKNESIDGIFV